MHGLTLSLAVAVAGGAGAALRHLVDLRVTERTRVPWALLLINATGSFALGLLSTAVGESDGRTVVATGLLGGYTTFSSASLDAAERWLDGRGTDGLRSALTMLATCVVAASTGVSIGG